MLAISATRTYVIDNQGTLSFYNLTTGNLEAYLDIASVRSGNDSTLGGSNIRFLTQSTSSTISGCERMRITSAGIANFACQVCSPSFNSTSTSYLNGLVVSCNVNSNCFTGITVYNGAGGGSEASRAGIAFQAYDWVQSAIWHGRNTAAAFAGALLFGTNPSTSNLGVGGVCTRLTIDNNGVSTFACTVCAPTFKGGSFLTSTCTFAATSAGTNYDITGPGSGRWLASVNTNAVYHWNGVLALTFFDSADFGVNILTCGSYNTAASVSIVNSGSSLRFCFSQNVGSVTVNYLNL
jgi:hypothetical protein